MYWAAFIVSSALVILAPGNKIRMSIISPKPFLTGFVAVIFNILEITWNIFKNPFFWFVLLAVFLYANQKQNKWLQNFYIKKLRDNKWLLPIMLLMFLIVSVSLPVISLKGSVAAERYLNTIVCFTLLLLLSFAFVLGLTIKPKLLSISILHKKIAVVILTITGLVSNTYFVNAYKSLIIVPVYNSILTERENTLKNAAQENKPAIVDSYDASLSKRLQTKYKSSSVTLKQIIQQKPPLLFFEDDFQTDYSIKVLKQFYGLDSIIIRKN